MAWFDPTKVTGTITSGGGTLTLNNLTKIYNDLLGRHSRHDGKIKNSQKYQEYLRSFEKFEFKGGDEKGREKIYKLVTDWKELAFKRGFLKEDLGIEWIGEIKKTVYNFRSTLDMRGEAVGGNYKNKDYIKDYATNVIEETAMEYSRGEKGLATIEGDILREGAMLLGETLASKGEDRVLLVYYPTKEEIVMQKLVKGAEKQRNIAEEIVMGSGVYTGSYTSTVGPSSSTSPSVSFSPSASPSPSPSPSPAPDI